MDKRWYCLEKTNLIFIGAQYKGLDMHFKKNVVKL